MAKRSARPKAADDSPQAESPQAAEGDQLDQGAEGDAAAPEAPAPKPRGPKVEAVEHQREDRFLVSYRDGTREVVPVGSTQAKALDLEKKGHADRAAAWRWKLEQIAHHCPDAYYRVKE